MRKLALICCLVFFTIFFGQKSRAQESTPAEPAKADQTPAHFYHLEFVIQEMGTDGKPTNSRSYTATVSTDSRDGRSTSIRTGSRIPVPTGPFSSGNDSQALVNTQFQYVDVGVNIDARRAHESGRELSLDLVADVTSVAPTNDARIHQPVIRQNKWQASVLIPIGKSAVVFTSDSLDSKGSMQVVVTATSLQ
jgi:Bacterial type II and III secretion system protein